MTSDYWTIVSMLDGECSPLKSDQQLRTVKCNKTGTVKTVSLRTYSYPCDIYDFGGEKKAGDFWGRDIISKTVFGEKSKLRALGVDSVEFAKKSKDVTINMLDGKKFDACLRKPGEIDFVKNFFKLLKRLK